MSLIELDSISYLFNLLFAFNFQQAISLWQLLPSFSFSLSIVFLDLIWALYLPLHPPAWMPRFPLCLSFCVQTPCAYCAMLFFFLLLISYHSSLIVSFLPFAEFSAIFINVSYLVQSCLLFFSFPLSLPIQIHVTLKSSRLWIVEFSHSRLGFLTTFLLSSHSMHNVCWCWFCIECSSLTAISLALATLRFV